MFMMGLVSMINVSYNMFSDPAFAVLIVIMIVACIVIMRLSVLLANAVGLWQIPDKGTGWHSSLGDGANDKYGVPDPGDIDTLKRIAEMASPENYIMNQKITQETFRYKFMDFNRLWLIERLPTVFTPRTLRRSRPYLIKQLARVLGVKPPTGGLGEDEEDDLVGGARASADAGDEVADALPPVKVAEPARRIASEWLAGARMRMRMGEAAQVFIARAKRPQCELCGSRQDISVELMTPTDALAERFIALNPRDRVLDVARWKAFFVEHERFRSTCHACVERRRLKARAKPVPLEQRTEDDEEAEARAQAEIRKGGPLAGRGDPRLGVVFLPSAARQLATDWLDKARRRRGAPVTRPDPAAVAAAAADEAERLGLDAPPFHGQRVALSTASRALAQRWLQNARFRITTRGVRVEDLAPIEGRERELAARARVEDRANREVAAAAAAEREADIAARNEAARQARQAQGPAAGLALPPRPMFGAGGPLPPRPTGLALPPRPAGLALPPRPAMLGPRPPMGPVPAASRPPTATQ